MNQGGVGMRTVEKGKTVVNCMQGVTRFKNLCNVHGCIKSGVCVRVCARALVL